jgi:hypothetical protein
MKMAFNEAIRKLRIIELPLSGQQYTWSNMQQNPLLERLDWFFISQAWSMEFPGTLARTLTRDLSNHVPCAVHIKTSIPRPRIFLF